MLIDSHCHLQDPKFSQDLEEVLTTAFLAGVEKVICVGTDLRDSKIAIEIANKLSENPNFPQIYATAGVYPHNKIQGESQDYDFREDLVNLAKNKRIVAIGECGLDYYKGMSHSEDKQKELFRKQVGAAVQLDLPIVIHNRNADNDILTELTHYKKTGKLKGVFHCFTGSKDFAHKILDLGFHISFAAVVTYPSAKDLEEVVKSVPRDRILIETDSPYLPPQAERGKRNEPKNVKIVAEKISEILGVSQEEIASQTAKNAIGLFKLN